MRVLLVVVAACASAQPPAPAAGVPQPAKAEPAPVETLAEPNRPLTAGEVALLRPIFRDGIDYASVRVIDNAFPLQPRNVYMTPRGHIYAPGELWSDDFSALRGARRGVFVHEMTHVWQHANGMDLIEQGVVEFTKYQGDYEKAYPYELDRARDLVDYGMEQQASIVEDYYLVTVDHEVPRRMTNRGLAEPDRDALYGAVLGKFFANARYAQALDARHVADQHAQASERVKPGPAACKESEDEHGAAHLCSWRYQPRVK